MTTRFGYYRPGGIVPNGQSSPSAESLRYTSTSGGATGYTIELYQNSASPAALDDVGIISFAGNDSGGNKLEYANISGAINSPTNGSEGGLFNIRLASAAASGAVRSALRFNTISLSYLGNTVAFQSGPTLALVYDKQAAGAVNDYGGFIQMHSPATTADSSTNPLLHPYVGYFGVRLNTAPTSNAGASANSEWLFNCRRGGTDVACFNFGATSGGVLGMGFFGTASQAKQVSGANLTNNVTSGGTDDTIANFTDLTTYANDSAAIRNNIYQLARKLKQVNDALRTYGLLT